MEKLKKCEHCGEMFYYERTSARYCSDACKQQAYLERRSSQFLSKLDVEDAEIVCSPEQPINEIEAIVPFEEIITEPEVINEPESPKPSQPEEINSTYIRKKRRKSYVGSSIPERQVRSDNNSSYDGMLALIGVAAGVLIGKAIYKSITPEEKLNKEETIVDRGDASEKFGDKIQKPTETIEENSDIPQNQKDSTQDEIHNSSILVEISHKIGNLLAKIFKRFNNLPGKLHIRKHTNQEIEKPVEDLADTPVNTENSPESLTKTKFVDPKVLEQLLQILQSVEKAKIEKDFRDRNTRKTDVTRKRFILRLYMKVFSGMQMIKNKLEKTYRQFSVNIKPKSKALK